MKALKRRLILKSICFWAVILFSQITQSQTMNITITNIRSTKGKLSISVFASAEEFKAGKPSFTRYFEKTNIKDKTCIINIPFKQGVYGLSVYDDENNNGKMDNNLIGLPKEGFGLSNYKIKGLTSPDFNDFNFQLKANENTSIMVELKYL